MQPIVIKDMRRDPTDDLLACQEAIRRAGWWERAGVEEHWPLNTDEATQLLAVAGEFDVDADELRVLIDRGLLPSPAKGEDGELEWSATDIIECTKQLTLRQQWRASPSRHDAYKHPCTVILEKARASGEVESIVNSTPSYDLRHLLAALVLCDASEGRQRLVALLRAVLEVEHGVVV